MRDDEIRIGNKSVNKYTTAILYSLDKYGTIIVTALGSRNGKAYEAIDKAEEMKKEIQIVDTDTFSKDNKVGIRIKLKCEGEIETEGVDFHE